MSAPILSLAGVADPRLAALYATALLDADPCEGFDRLTRLAARLLDAPVALLTLVAEDRQFFLSAQGLTEPVASARGTPLTHSYCQYAVNSRTPLVVPDAREHPLLWTNPAIEELGAIAYCGIPLFSSDGFAIGTLCVLDGEPRAWSEENLATLGDLAAMCATEIQLRASATARARSEQWARRQQAILELIAHGAELRTVLGAIARHVEADSAGAACSVLLLDEDGSILHGATPAALLRGHADDDVDPASGDETGYDSGSEATHWPLHPFDTDDIATDLRWEPWRATALAEGFEACWTTPITADDTTLLGTIVVYAPTTGRPSAADRQLVLETAELARIAIDRHRIVARLRRQDAMLQRAQMHEALGRLAGVVAHEFNSLLTAVLAAAAALRGRRNDALSSQDLDIIDDAARKASMLTARLLAAAGRRYLRPRAVALTEWVETLRGTIEADLPPTVHFCLDTPSADLALVVPADPAALGEAVLALVDNAVAAMPDGGHLTLRIAAARFNESDESPTTPEGRRLPAGSYACVTVEDTGSGMQDVELANALDFFGGSGLSGVRPDGSVRGFGLPLVAGIVRQSGGHVSARSTPGAGTAVTLWLPTDAPAARLVSEGRITGATPPPAIATPAVVPGTRGTVLLVDDEPTIRRVLQRALERVGYTVIEAADGAAGWERFKAHATEISAVLCDWRMPGLDGRALRALLLGRQPGLPVLIMSGYGDISGADDDGRIEMLSKPFEIDDVIARLDSMIAAAYPARLGSDRKLA